jgi:hypothetical protein
MMSQNDNTVGAEAAGTSSSKSDMWSSFKDVAKAAIDRAPSWAAPFIMLAFALAIISTFIGLLTESQRAVPLIIAFVLLGLIVLAVVVLSVMGRADIKRKDKVVFRRVCPVLDDETRQALDTQIEQIHTKAVDSTGVSDPRQIRANAFVASTPEAGKGEIVSLAMEFNVNIPEDECGLRFFVNEGVTGMTFTKGFPLAAFKVDGTNDVPRWRLIRLPEGTLIAADQPTITDQRRIQLVAADLCWIVSFPLTIAVEGVEIVMGVLNIDGRFAGDDARAKKLYDDLREDVKAFGRRLGQAPQKDYVKIVVENFVDGGAAAGA